MRRCRLARTDTGVIIAIAPVAATSGNTVTVSEVGRRVNQVDFIKLKGISNDKLELRMLN